MISCWRNRMNRSHFAVDRRCASEFPAGECAPGGCARASLRICFVLSLFWLFGTTILYLGRCFQPTKTISPFFSFFLVPLYVGYVPASDDLGICCFIWRYEFSSKFSSMTEEKSSFRREAADLPKHFKFWEIPK